MSWSCIDGKKMKEKSVPHLPSCCCLVVSKSLLTAYTEYGGKAFQSGTVLTKKEKLCALMLDKKR